MEIHAAKFIPQIRRKCCVYPLGGGRQKEAFYSGTLERNTGGAEKETQQGSWVGGGGF